MKVWNKIGSLCSFFAGAEVIVHSPNLCRGMAFKTGFAAAEGADIIVTMDSNGQHNPADIPKLVAPILKGEADMVNGSRYLNGHATDTPAYRRIDQTILGKATVVNSGIKITDSQSGFRAFSASIKDTFRFNEQGHGNRKRDACRCRQVWVKGKIGANRCQV